LNDITARVDDELRTLAASGPTADEMERGVAQAEAHFMYRLQTIGGFGGKSDQLNAYNVLLGTPGYFTQDLDRYRQATHESVRSAVARYLVGARRVSLSIVPRGRRDLAIADAEPVSVS
jgi:zinc protease